MHPIRGGQWPSYLRAVAKFLGAVAKLPGGSGQVPGGSGQVTCSVISSKKGQWPSSGAVAKFVCSPVRARHWPSSRNTTWPLGHCPRTWPLP